jgi:hypothetical protein
MLETQKPKGITSFAPAASRLPFFKVALLNNAFSAACAFA